MTEPDPTRKERSCVLRTRIYRVCPTPEFIASLTRCRHAQRAAYNLAITALPSVGGRVPATMSSPDHPDAFYGLLTRWRAETPWLASIPTALTRPALAQARAAMDMHEQAVRARVVRIFDERTAWAAWAAENPNFDSGAWDALDVEGKRAAMKAGTAPPKSASTWRDERAGDGSRRGLFRRRRTSARCAVTWLVPPKRVDAVTLALPGLGAFQVLANGLPEASRLRSARVCVKHGSRGRTRYEVHLSVQVDVEPRTKRRRKTPLVAGGDAGVADTLTLHTGKTLTLADHDVALDTVLRAQHGMSKCVKGSRQWLGHLERLRAAKRAMVHRDRDAVRKAAKALAAAWDVIGLESLNITGMGASARGRSWGGVAAKRGLNRKIRAALWGFAQNTLGAAFDARGGQVLKLPAMDSSRTCAECGHVDAASRDGKRFRCTACGHTAHADVNAARVLRARALRWLELTGGGLTDGEANDALWKELRATRKACAGHAGARNKPARKATGAQQHSGGAGAPSSGGAIAPPVALAEGESTRRGDRRSGAAGPDGGHKQRLSV